MMFGGKLEEKDSHQQLDAYIEKGGNMLDTANIYGRSRMTGDGYAGRSEEIIGTWMKERRNREDVILAVSYTHLDVYKRQVQYYRWKRHERGVPGVWTECTLQCDRSTCD